MEGFMPSEIARLVLGYLKETRCKKTVGMFLNECPHLTEYVELLLNGKEYPTSINGKSLPDILSEYSQLKSQGVRKTPVSVSTPLCARSLLLSTRRAQSITSTSVGCGEADVGQRQIGCQTASTSQSHLVEVGTQIESTFTTPVKNYETLPTALSLTTPCRPLDFYSSPSTLVKTALFNNLERTPTRYNDSDNVNEPRSANSPRRKGPIPRKRLYSPSSNSVRSTPPLKKKRDTDDGEMTSMPSTPASIEDNVTGLTSNAFNFAEFINGMLQNPVLPERIAANINEEKSHPTIYISETHDNVSTDSLVRKALVRTETDPLFEEFLNDFVLDKQDGNSRDSQNSLFVTAPAANVDKPNDNITTSDSSDKPAETEEVNGQTVDINATNWSADTNGTIVYIVADENLQELVISSGTNATTAEQLQSSENSRNLQVPPNVNKEKEFTTLSPGQLFSSCAMSNNTEKQLNQRPIVAKKATPIASTAPNIMRTVSDRTKRSFARRKYAVKALNFGHDSTNLQSTSSVTMTQPKERVRLSKNKPAPLSEVSIAGRPRLHSLLRTAGNLDLNKPSDTQILLHTNITTLQNSTSDTTLKNSGNQIINKDKLVSNRYQNNSNDHSVSDKTGVSNKGSDTTDAVLKKMNVDEFLSGMQY